MLFFKNIDEKLAELGYVQEAETLNSVVYYKEHTHFTQKVVIERKEWGDLCIRSYDPNTFDCKSNNSCVGLTYADLKLFAKKMKEIESKGFVN